MLREEFAERLPDVVILWALDSLLLQAVLLLLLERNPVNHQGFGADADTLPKL